MTINRAKISLSHTPTPVHRLEKLSAHLAADIWMKRDDLTGSIVTGGNKIRKLEYILADALEQGADTIITTGGPQSNHAKITAALAIQVGLKPVLVLAGDDPGARKANLFLNELMGAEIRFSGARTLEQMEQSLQDTYQELQREGHKPYIIPIGGSNGLGSLGYIDAYAELEQQLQERRTDDGKQEAIHFDWMVVTAGSGGTFAGLYIGNQNSRHPAKLLGVSPWLATDQIEARIKQCILEAEDEAQPKGQSNLQDTSLLLDDQYIGKGYGKITPEAQEAIHLLATKEAILLDHVYTGKTMAAILDYIQKGVISKHERVLFWHTGGAPALMADNLLL